MAATEMQAGDRVPVEATSTTVSTTRVNVFTYVRAFPQSSECDAFIAFDIGQLGVYLSPVQAALLGAELVRAAAALDGGEEYSNMREVLS